MPCRNLSPSLNELGGVFLGPFNGDGKTFRNVVMPMGSAEQQRKLRLGRGAGIVRSTVPTHPEVGHGPQGMRTGHPSAFSKSVRSALTKPLE